MTNKTKGLKEQTNINIKSSKVADKPKKTTTKSKVNATKKAVKKGSESINKKVSPEKTSSKVNSKKTVTHKLTSDSVTKKTPIKKVPKVSTNKKATTTKKIVKTNASKKATNKPVVKKAKSALNFIEYYDLPYRYNQTTVKVLAQTPTTLFVYWDIADIDRINLINQFSNDFFNTTYPVLIVHNKTFNYSFEIPINDFANSWYFSVNDAKCDYIVELGRRAKNDEIDLPNNYVYISSSNQIEAPNDHILFEKTQETVYFRNVKNDAVVAKNIINLQFIHRIGRIYNMHDLYKKLYKNENISKLDNPSSRFTI